MTVRGRHARSDASSTKGWRVSVRRKRSRASFTFPEASISTPAVTRCSGQNSSMATAPLPAELSFLRPNKEIQGLHGDRPQMPDLAQRSVHGDEPQIGAKVVRSGRAGRPARRAGCRRLRGTTGGGSGRRGARRWMRGRRAVTDTRSCRTQPVLPIVDERSARSLRLYGDSGLRWVICEVRWLSRTLCWQQFPVSTRWSRCRWAGVRVSRR
jgi:hypothetical protein